VTESDAAARDEIGRIFDQYVFGFIQADLTREIWMATTAEEDRAAGRKHFGAGNVLCALGLVCYTEFLGSFVTGRANEPMKNFEAFLDRMGDCYKKAMAEDGHRLWEFFRNGMVHEYAVKRDCKVVMLRNGDSCGLGKADDGTYYFVAQRYFDDFMAAAKGLHQDLLKTPVLPK
jgi:hypothetical protein